MHADEAASWDNLHERFEIKRMTIRRHTASMARALTWLRNTFPAYDPPRSESITTSPVRISSGTLRILHGVRITAASRMAIR